MPKIIFNGNLRKTRHGLISFSSHTHINKKHYIHYILYWDAPYKLTQLKNTKAHIKVNANRVLDSAKIFATEY